MGTVPSGPSVQDKETENRLSLEEDTVLLSVYVGERSKEKGKQ